MNGRRLCLADDDDGPVDGIALRTKPSMIAVAKAAVFVFVFVDVVVVDVVSH